MGAHLRVQVPLRAGHSEQSEAQLREGDRAWGRQAWSLNRELMNKNRIEGAAKQGERAMNHEALVTVGEVA
jgi:hypothetical protein